jgi:hypothetical protein
MSAYLVALVILHFEWGGGLRWDCAALRAQYDFGTFSFCQNACHGFASWSIPLYGEICCVALSEHAPTIMNWGFQIRWFQQCIAHAKWEHGGSETTFCFATTI